MQNYKTEFLELALAHGVLKFGEFKLKSGRLSPYFFNLGLVSDGASLRTLGRAYAQALEASGIAYDMLFGPAYKGIPLVSAVAIALADQGRSVPYAYNRKEAKDHGEGGLLVGAKPQGRVVIVDDVLTAGTALRESVQQLRAAGANPVAAIIALDRQERVADGLSAVAAMEKDSGIRVVSLVNVREMLEFLGTAGLPPSVAESVAKYQAQHGVPG